MLIDPNEIEERKLEKSVAGLFASKKNKSNKKSIIPISSSPSSSNVAKDLGVRAAMRTRLKTDPFLQQTSSSSTGLFRKKNDESKFNNVMVRPNKKIRIDNDQEGNQKPFSKDNGLVSYASSSDEEDNR